MTSIIKTIVEKMKIKEICAILFIAGIIITFMPTDYAIKFGIDKFRGKYQMYISIGLIVIVSFYILNLITWLSMFLLSRIANDKRIGMKYLKDVMSADEMGFLIEIFYDKEHNIFRNTGYIEMSDGRGAGLVNRHVIYLSSQISNLTYFSYNLQPWAYKFLNQKLKEGNIIVNGRSIQYQLK